MFKFCNKVKKEAEDREEELRLEVKKYRDILYRLQCLSVKGAPDRVKSVLESYKHSYSGTEDYLFFSERLQYELEDAKLTEKVTPIVERIIKEMGING